MQGQPAGEVAVTDIDTGAGLDPGAEGAAGLARQARMHAALGEPLRLAIADQLTLGDAAPGELSRRFGVPGNLLAHHLRRLERGGVIRRVRSEGDHRRGYVQLRLDDPVVAAITYPGRLRMGDPLHRTRRVVFVCSHNSARSQLAEAAWRQLSPVPATSAGTHPAPRLHPHTVTTGLRHGLPLAGARTSHLTEVGAGADDLVVAVCDSAYEELLPDGPAPPRLHWSVPDPVRVGTEAAFDAAYTDLARRLRWLAGMPPQPEPAAPAGAAPR